MDNSPSQPPAQAPTETATQTPVLPTAQVPVQNPASQISTIPGTAIANNQTWTKTIPILNYITLAIMIGFGIFDLQIAISTPELRSFGIPMIFAGIIFLTFMFLENFVYKARYAHSSNSHDTGIVVMVSIRNIILVLNVVPLIQLVGLILFIPFCIPWLIVYVFMMHLKHKTSSSQL